jgi:hypothetical protein
MNNIMNNICQSVKSKTELDKRCTRHVSKDCLCGIHSRSKNIIFFDDIQSKIYTLETIPPYNKIDKEHIKINLNYYKVKTKNKRDNRILYTLLLNYLNENAIKYKKSLIIQKYIRRYLIQRLKQCVNQEDFYSLENIIHIPLKYTYILKETKVNYCFDLRSLFEYFKSKDDIILNPYNNVKLSDNDIKNIRERFNKYKNDNDFQIEQEPLSPRQLQTQQIISVFQHYDNLGFILNIEWFSKLRFEQLKHLYRKCEDIWNYRAQLTNEQKLGIVHNGKLFTIPVLTINRMRRHKDKELRNILLTEFNRAVTEGTNDANRRLGAILMLTGFAEVSYDVLNSYPWLSQSF